eukprot:CAMPEP_0206566626 /NCGR_PEP_ID=MMETSP0325_2-20121206/24771_1 /ASSEMBLY_ACC=CAM_ASM_000347 /TAXON_ID=2866 /ORGANISM="Crypthecodinium cohnii, Strain Seligo" /LENGTH=219 /DNA_ID=CAMNT_0054069693 /DNA_START=121 /DNA_END=778 /DNA_ORIENTATION=-
MARSDSKDRSPAPRARSPDRTSREPSPNDAAAAAPLPAAGIAARLAVALPDVALAEAATHAAEVEGGTRAAEDAETAAALPGGLGTDPTTATEAEAEVAAVAVAGWSLLEANPAATGEAIGSARSATPTTSLVATNASSVEGRSPETVVGLQSYPSHNELRMRSDWTRTTNEFRIPMPSLSKVGRLNSRLAWLLGLTLYVCFLLSEVVLISSLVLAICR